MDVPAQQHREHQGRRVNREAHGQAPLNEKQGRRQGAGFQVETALQVFVGRVDLQAVEDGHHRDREHHHGERQPQVELHEAHAVHIGLTRRGEEGDGAGLGRHDGEADGVPAGVPVGQQVAFRILAVAALPEPEEHDESQGPAQDEPVEATHEKIRPKA